MWRADKVIETKTLGLLVDAGEVAKMLGIGTRTVWRLHSGGRIPAPIRLGGAVRWRRQELIDWIAAGCPARTRWEARGRM